MHKSTLIILCFIIALFLTQSCETFDPKEDIPAYIKIDTLMHPGLYPTGYSCAYVYVNYSLVGVFEVPRTIPVLVSDSAIVTIRPGINKNGANYTRTYYEMAEPYQTKVFLEPTKTVTINPTTVNKAMIETPWFEDFETSAISMQAKDSLSPQLQVVRQTRPGHTGYIGEIKISPSDTLTNKYEYEYYDSMLIYFQGVPSYLELSYKSTQPFEVRLNAYLIRNNQLHDKSVMHIFASPDQWKRIHIDFSSIVTDLGPGVFYKPYIRLYRNDNTGEQDTIKVCLDDLRIVYEKR
ncbi:MAG: hypothetical protein PHU27_02835 [Salinivirgaceae bacterium]|nr:hypothetical protein [Salinivirgaceae bacterium]MDD4746412.1 hypothetical protein [Salinivirgaceae bacterium]MDY0279707.1 hypothetical protein [Salinivirgaceae bacterium]